MKPFGKDVDDYLVVLRRSLKSLPAKERDEVVSEITAHIRDSMEQGLAAEPVLLQLGAPKELAAQYRDTVWVQRAARTRAPWSMLESSFWLAKKGIIGAACFALALIGYVAGGGLLLTALLKPFFPSQIGFWVGPGVFHFGFHDAGISGGGVGLLLLTGGSAHEVLGSWYIPVTCALAALFIGGTTNLLRKLVRRIRTKDTPTLVPLQPAKPIAFS